MHHTPDKVYEWTQTANTVMVQTWSWQPPWLKIIQEVKGVDVETQQAKSGEFTASCSTLFIPTRMLF